MVAETDTGARNPTGAIPKKVLFYVPLAWTIFQLWYASPLPFIFNFAVFNYTEARAIHLAFAMFLSYTAYPTFKSSPRDYIPIQDWLWRWWGHFAAAYLYIFYESLSQPPRYADSDGPDRVDRRPDTCCWRPPAAPWARR